MTRTETLPRLLDRKAIADRLGVKLATAERIMRGCPKITIGARVFVTEKAVADYLRSRESDA